MRNPFKKNNWHNELHDDLSELIIDILFDFSRLRKEVETLREELDFLIDELDD